jgi:hypothetical protein
LEGGPGLFQLNIESHGWNRFIPVDRVDHSRQAAFGLRLGFAGPWWFIQAMAMTWSTDDGLGDSVDAWSAGVEGGPRVALSHGFEVAAGLGLARTGAELGLPGFPASAASTRQGTILAAVRYSPSARSDAVRVRLGAEWRWPFGSGASWAWVRPYSSVHQTLELGAHLALLVGLELPIGRQ